MSKPTILFACPCLRRVPGMAGECDRDAELSKVRAIRGAVAVAVTLVLAVVMPSSAATRNAFFAGCARPTATPTVVVGAVSCLETPSKALGGTTAFSYYVPPACAPGREVTCPVIYLLHGFGGSYTSMLGTAKDPSAYVAALSSGPTVDPHSVNDPWDYSDPAKWVRRSSIDAVLIAPDGRTVPGGYGPEAGLDGYWIDWNPDHAKGGAHASYATPAPRFEAQLLGELVPYVQRTFPVGRGRAWRALTGESLGGFGAYAIGLRHPDLFSSLGSVSGAMNFLFAPGVDPTGATSPVQVSSPVGTPALDVPGPTESVPLSAIPSPARDFGVALVAFGDPGTEQAYFRGHMPRDLARNGYGFRGSTQSLDIVGFSNDAIAHNPSDLADPAHFIGSQAFESIVLPMNTDQRLAFTDAGVTWHYELHPGTHSGEYWNAWYRGLYEHQYALLRHPGGGGPHAEPTLFAFRSTDRSFRVWGWQVSVRRPVSEFLNLVSVTCHSVTLRGSGQVTVTVPARCGTGVSGSRTFSVGLGHSMPVGEPAGIGAAPAYGRTVTVPLHRR